MVNDAFIRYRQPMSLDSWAPYNMKGAYKNCYYFLIKCSSRSSVIYQRTLLSQTTVFSRAVEGQTHEI